MEFGKISEEELLSADLTLPPDSGKSVDYLDENKDTRQTRIYVGCAKWGQKDWVGKIYREGSSEEEFLDQYIAKYDALELDSTFYNIQRKNVQKLIDAAKGKEFKYCPKFNRRISHAKTFEETKDLTGYFVSLMLEFGENLGVCILQFPEYFAVKRMEELDNFLATLPPEFPVSVELRNKGWFSEPNHPVFDMLRKRSAGAAITDTAGRRDAVHMQITNPNIVIRYVGNNMHPTDFARIDAWAGRINEWKRYNALEAIYFFVHNDDEGYSPAMAGYMAERLRETGAPVKAPVIAY